MRIPFATVALLLVASAGAPAPEAPAIRLIGKTKYLNNARAVVTHTIDDSTKYVTNCIDAMDKYGVKATIFVSTEQDPAPEDRFLTQLQVRDLWPRLRQAIDNGHEIGSHSRQHPCKRPDTEAFCSSAYSDYEVTGSRDDILRLTQQPYVWSWCYPCGHCANYDFIQKKIAAAGYVVARNYPNEAQDGHIMPDLQTWDANPMNAAYTQVVQKRGGAAKTERIDTAVLNAKFDEILERGGIYNFMSHPQWLDYGADGFYERHLAHISHRKDVWYVPMGPLYAYRTIHDSTEVRALGPSRFELSNRLDPKVYSGAITLDFAAPEGVTILSGGRKLDERADQAADRWNQEYFRREGGHVFVTVRSNTVLEFVAATAARADVAGPWKLTYTTENGLKREAVMDLKLNGDTLEGTVSSDRGSARVEEGKLSGARIRFQLVRKSNGDEITVKYQGTVEAGTMRLAMQVGQRAPIEVVASREAAQDFNKQPVEEVAAGFPGGEGPVWSRDGFLLFSDYDKDRIYKYTPGKSPEVYREGSNGANGNAMDREGRLYTCEYRSRRVTRTDRKGRIEVIADRFEGKRFNAPNDIVVRRDGHVYFTDPLFTPLDHRDLDFYGVYHLAPKGQLEAIAKMQTRPNGIALSPDGKTLYVANTDEKNIRAYDLDSAGRASHERIAIPDLGAGPDGMRVDVKGNLYIAARGVQVYSPDGKLLGRIQTAVNPRNLAFGDADFRTLYIVGNTLYRVRLDVAGAVQY